MSGFGAGLSWLADYLRWRGIAGLPLALWQAGFCRLAPRGRRLRAPVGDGRTARLRARTDDLDHYRRQIVRAEFEMSADRAAAVDRRCARARAAGRRPLIIDAHAGIGLFSQAAARRWPQAEVLCMEAHRGALALARRNCTGLRNLRFRDAALRRAPDGAGDAWMGAEEADPPDARASGRGLAEISGETVSIDSLLAERPDCDLVLLKLDDAGAEAEALDRQARFWRHRPALLIAPDGDVPARRDALRALLAQDDFRDADLELRDGGLFVFPTERPELERRALGAPTIAAAG